MKVLVLGGGLFGLPTALSLRERGHEVCLADPGPIPHPLAAATDVSKAVRMDYVDPVYVTLGEAALAGWDRWNARSPRPFFHRTGVWFLSSKPPAPEQFEAAARRLVAERGYPVTGITAGLLAERFAAVNRDLFAHGYVSETGGWAESGEAMAWLAGEARAAGVNVMEGWAATSLVEQGGRVTGARSVDGRSEGADMVVAAVGVWTGALLPELDQQITVTGQPVVFFAPEDPGPFRHPNFAVWTADIETIGWYGFPALPDGRVKIAFHGVGRPIGPDDPREVTPDELAACVSFAEEIFPDLTGAPVVGTRLCLYANSPSTGFLVDRHPDRPGLVVATGGTGHAFKFAPVIGDVVADVVEGKPHRHGDAFSWRTSLEIPAP